MTMNNSVKLAARDLNFYYGKFRALDSISVELNKNQVSALIGDMSINIGEQITFFVEGVNVKHKFVEIDGEH